MIAVEDVHGAAFGSCLHGESIEKVEDLDLVVAPVELVPGLDEHRRTAGPPVLVVDGSRQAQRGPRGREVPVQVSDGDDAFRCRKLRGEVQPFDRGRRHGFPAPAAEHRDHREDQQDSSEGAVSGCELHRGR